jgi:predicted nucleic acid-binding protein
MSVLLDTSILVRLANTADLQYPVALEAILELHRSGETLFTTPQVFVEFRNVSTRPKSVNGLGLTSIEAELKATGFESRFPILPDQPAIHTAWKLIVSQADVLGKQVHDARLVAVCHVHQVAKILTFNGRHFSRFSSLHPGLQILDPFVIGIS